MQATLYWGMAKDDTKNSVNRAFRISLVNEQRLKELAEFEGVTENACVNLAIADLWQRKIEKKTS